MGARNKFNFVLSANLLYWNCLLYLYEFVEYNLAIMELLHLSFNDVLPQFIILLVVIVVGLNTMIER